MTSVEDAMALAVDAIVAGTVSDARLSVATAASRMEAARVAERENAALRREIIELRSRLEAQRVAYEHEVQALRAEAALDPMTGVLNRRGFDDRFNSELRRAERTGGSVALAMVDVDHFKSVNDEGGHPFGDRVLKSLAARLRTVTKRETDFAGRIGGEEFALVFAALGLPGASAIVSGLQQSLRLNPILRPDGSPLTISVGLTSTAEDGFDASLLTSSADEALYAAKQSGRDRALSSVQARSLAFVDDVGQDEAEDHNDAEAEAEDGFARDDVATDRVASQHQAQELVITEQVQDRFVSEVTADASTAHVQPIAGALVDGPKTGGVKPARRSPQR